MLGSGNPAAISNLASSCSEIDLRNILRCAKRPEIQVQSGNDLEDEIAKYLELKEKALSGKNYARAYDFTDALEELESLRSNFPKLDDLIEKEKDYKERFKEFLKAKKYSEANAMKRKILEVKKTMLKEKHARSEEKKTAALMNGDTNDGELLLIEMIPLTDKLKLHQQISQLDASKTLTDNTGEATLQILRDGGSCTLVISSESVLDYSYTDGLSGFVCWTNECCDLSIEEVGSKVLAAGGDAFKEELGGIETQATTDWGDVKCPTGEAVMIGPLTFSEMTARFIFLAVGPMSSDNDDTEWDRADETAMQIMESELRASYRSALQLVGSTGVEAIAIPTLTTNAAGGAYERSLWVGLKTIVEEAKSTHLQAVSLCAASPAEANLLIKMALILGLSV